MKIGPVVSELWGVENRPLPLTWPMAYATACTTVPYVTSVRVTYERGHCSLISLCHCHYRSSTATCWIITDMSSCRKITRRYSFWEVLLQLV